MADEHRIARLLLGLTPGDGVLDVACGPGNFTRDFARSVGDAGPGRWASTPPRRCSRARCATRRGPVRATSPTCAATPCELPFRDASFDAVCCFAALHLFAEPVRALDHMARVLTPGGRIAIFTAAGRARRPLRDGRRRSSARAAGMRMFERDEITGALEERGFADVRQRVSGLTQFVGAQARRKATDSEVGPLGR